MIVPCGEKEDDGITRAIDSGAWVRETIVGGEGNALWKQTKQFFLHSNTRESLTRRRNLLVEVMLRFYYKEF
jgi:hypothetical protein